MSLEEPPLHRNYSFKIEDNNDNRQLLKQLRVLAAQDGWSFSRIVRTAIEEYVKRHQPGNNQLVLRHWTERLALPITLQEECEHEPGLVEIPGIHGAKWTRCLKCGAKL